MAASSVATATPVSTLVIGFILVAFPVTDKRAVDF
jgi:hypothetical protein